MSFIDPLDELRALSAGVRPLNEGGIRYFDLPKLTFLSVGQEVTMDALLCLDPHSGYSTRLFLERPIPERGNNWTAHVIFGRQWHTWSWNHVPATLRPMQILAEHLRALK